MDFIIAIISLITIIIAIRYFLWKSSQRALLIIDQDWEGFLKASASSNINRINLFGGKLIYNKHLKQAQLEKIIEVVDEHFEKFPELEDLKLKAFNKKLHYDRPLPTQGGYLQ